LNIDREQINCFVEAIRDNTGTDLSEYCGNTLSARISHRLSQIDLDPDSYLNFCRNDPDECQTLVDTIAVNVSWFFRNPIVFEIIAQTILPRLIAKTKTIRVWSAGCAGGEEAYSIAILIRDLLNSLPNAQPQALVFATDIDQEVLAKARTGYYPQKSLSDVKMRFVEECFTPKGDGYLVRPSVREMVRFSTDNLLNDQTIAPAESIFGSFDLILCRNVLIYFSAERIKKVIHKLYESLATGGYLVLGESEDISRDLKARLNTVDRRNRIYQK
jgi:chemotaxis protein methyltransferase CheR